jgi:glycosyltransferase involved in cell wall biosynthesis
LGQPFKVLINGLHAKSGGGVTYLRNMLPFFAADGAIETHLCIHESQSDIFSDVPDGIILHTMNFRSGFWRLPYYEQILVPRLARDIAATVTFSPANYGPLFAPGQITMLRNALGVAFVEKRFVKTAYWVVAYVGTLLSMIRSKKVIAVSDFVLHTTGKMLSQMFAAKSLVIHHGVSDVYAPPKKEQAREDFILAVSDIYVQKNFGPLLLAVDSIRKKHPGVLLKIAGRKLDQGYFDALQQIITDRSMQDNVSFLGSVTQDELFTLYRSCRFFVFPSLVESFGNPLVEAMASGAPIATSNTAAMPEVVGPAALLFDPANVPEIASALERLYEDEALRHDLCEKSLQRAKSFSWSKTAMATLDVIKSVAARGRG